MNDIARRLLKEKISPGQSYIHADSPHGAGVTLCGYAYEGLADGSDYGVVEVTRGKITCGTCSRIILFCKAFPADRLLQRRRKS
jgi:hypothetical protein